MIGRARPALSAVDDQTYPNSGIQVQIEYDDVSSLSAGKFVTTTQPRRPVFLDHHSTTPIDPRVLADVNSSLRDFFGNAHSSEHFFGVAARNAVEAARAQVAELLGAPTASVEFFDSASGAIEAALRALALVGRRAVRIAASPVEHSAVLTTIRMLESLGLAELVCVKATETGAVNLDQLAVAINGVDCLCVQSANNEVGTLNDLWTIATIASTAGAITLIDASQSAGFERLPLTAFENASAVVSSHKLYGPKGAAALVGPVASIHKGTRLHAPTPNVPSIVGFGRACSLRHAEMELDHISLVAKRNALQRALLAGIDDLLINGDLDARLAFSLHASAPGTPNGAVLARLFDSVSISTGAACSYGVDESSHVLKAIGMSTDLIDGALRIGVGKFTTDDEIAFAGDQIVRAVREVRAGVRRSP